MRLVEIPEGLQLNGVLDGQKVTYEVKTYQRVKESLVPFFGAPVLLKWKVGIVKNKSGEIIQKTPPFGHETLHGD